MKSADFLRVSDSVRRQFLVRLIVRKLVRHYMYAVIFVVNITTAAKRNHVGQFPSVTILNYPVQYSVESLHHNINGFQLISSVFFIAERMNTKQKELHVEHRQIGSFRFSNFSNTTV